MCHTSLAAENKLRGWYAVGLYYGTNSTVVYVGMLSEY